MHWLAVAVGGALGAMARYGVSSIIFNPSSQKFPWATMSVNVLGSFVMGLLFVIIVEKGALPTEMRSLLMIGFLGAFTTFSTFSLELLLMIERGEWVLSLVYAFASLVSCFAGVYFGAQFARWLS